MAGHAATAGYFDEALECFALEISLIDDDTSSDNRKNLAKTIGEVGRVYFQLGKFMNALECYQEDAKLAGDLYAGTTEQENLYQCLGTIYMHRTEFVKALEYYRKALDIARNILPSSHLTFHALNNAIGTIYLHQGFLDLSLECYTKVIESLSPNLESSNTVLAVHANLGLLYILQNRFDLSLASYNKAISLHLERDSTSSHPILANIYVQYANLLKKQLKHGEAQIVFLKAYAIYQKRNMPLKMAACLTEMGLLHLETGNFRQALICMSNALLVRKRSCCERDVSIAITYREMSIIWLKLGDAESALKCIGRSMMLFILSSANGSLECATTYQTLGCIYLHRSNPLLAIQYFKKTLRIRRMHLPEDHAQIGMVYHQLGQAYGLCHRFDVAQKYFNTALATNAENYLIYRDIGSTHYLLENYDQALESFEKALEGAKLTHNNDHLESCQDLLDHR